MRQLRYLLRLRHDGVSARAALSRRRRSRFGGRPGGLRRAGRPGVSATVSCGKLGRRVSSFRWLPQNASAPMRNCLDFGWRGRRRQKSGSLARTCGNGGLSPQLPRAAGGLELIAAAKS